MLKVLFYSSDMTEPSRYYYWFKGKVKTAQNDVELKKKKKSRLFANVGKTALSRREKINYNHYQRE